MIVFVPGYDSATNANLSVARGLVSARDIALLASAAARECLIAELCARETEALFSMSHGRPDRLCAQDGDIALFAEDVTAIGRRSVYAFACHTATRLGREMSKYGATWWGYTGAIQCPDDSEPFRIMFVEIFKFIFDSFAVASTAAERRTVLEEIAKRCEAAQGLVDEYFSSDSNLDVVAAYHCLLHIWDRLRVWCPGAIDPEAHAHAQPPLLF